MTVFSENSDDLLRAAKVLPDLAKAQKEWNARAFQEALVKVAKLPRNAGILFAKPSYRANLLASVPDPILADACRPFVAQKIPTLKGKRHGRAR